MQSGPNVPEDVAFAIEHALQKFPRTVGIPRASSPTYRRKECRRRPHQWCFTPRRGIVANELEIASYRPANSRSRGPRDYGGGLWLFRMARPPGNNSATNRAVSSGTIDWNELSRDCDTVVRNFPRWKTDRIHRRRKQWTATDSYAKNERGHFRSLMEPKG